MFSRNIRPVRATVATTVALAVTAAVALVATPAAGTPRRPWRTPQHLTPVSTVDSVTAPPPADLAAMLAAAAPKAPVPAWPDGGTAVLALRATSPVTAPAEPLAPRGTATASAVVGGIGVSVSVASGTAP